MVDLGEISKAIRDHGLRLAVLVAERPFESEAWKFLLFAQEDLKQSDDRARVNALSNAKRAVDNRVDTLLHTYCLRLHARKERWNYPAKAEQLRQAGVFVPTALQDLITSTRNDLEHEYKIPLNQREVRNSVEVGELFLRATDQVVSQGNFRWVVATPRLPPSPESIRISGLDPQDYGIAFDRVKGTMTGYKGADSVSVPFLSLDAGTLGGVLRTIYAAFQPRATVAVGPLDERTFTDSFS